MQQRQCVILQGDSEWCKASSDALLQDIDANIIICLSNNEQGDWNTLPVKQAQQQLGKEFDAVVFDALGEFNPDSFGVIIGTIKAGGVLILWLPEQVEKGLWLQRFLAISREFEQKSNTCHLISQGESLPQLLPIKHAENLAEIYHTEDQQQAVAAILKVVHGHRRRPLVLSADRGRGKSAALGIAAAQLIEQGKQAILVTAPSLSIVNTVFKHAAYLLPDATVSNGLISIGNAEIRFVAPDELIESALTADLVLVDEAAAIPAAMLEKILQKYSRLAFATTLHGYEGTGRGFAVRFQQTLDQKTPSWQKHHMKTAIRWDDDDELEKFSFQALLLNATPVKDGLVSDADSSDCQITLLDRQQIITNEQDLSELFGLMVLAHYRTRPSDLKMMLDRDDVSVYIVRYKGHIIASAWLVNEGLLDANLSQAVYEGARRLKGHLLPQSLLAHAGVSQAGVLRYQRIVRIVVHPTIQQRNIGQELIEFCIEQAKQENIDVLGASFAMSTELVGFWSKLDFAIARVGSHKDEVSGGHSVMMLQAFSKQGSDILNLATQRFQQQWPLLLTSQFKQLTVEHVISICQKINITESVDVDMQEINAFAHQQRSYEASQITLWNWVCLKVGNNRFCDLDWHQQKLCVQLVLQQHTWPSLNYSGKAQAVTALREAVAVLLKD